jgi:hypothetical protein
MCDYSLMALPNRLAREGEELMTHRFLTGSIGLASVQDLCCAEEAKSNRRRGFWAAVKEFFEEPQGQKVPAVCIPPGARLRLHEIPAVLQRKFGVGPEQEVTFTQMTAAVNSYRDAIRFSNGREVLLQQLPEGQHVEVLDLSSAEDLRPVAAEWPRETLFAR